MGPTHHSALKCKGARQDVETETIEAERKEGQGCDVTNAETTCFQERKAVRSHVTIARFEKK